MHFLAVVFILSLTVAWSGTVKAGFLTRPKRSVNDTNEYDEVPQQILGFAAREAIPYPIALGNKSFFGLLHNPCGKGNASRPIRFNNHSTADVLNIRGRVSIVKLIVGMVDSMLDALDLGVRRFICEALQCVYFIWLTPFKIKWCIVKKK